MHEFKTLGVEERNGKGWGEERKTGQRRRERGDKKWNEKRGKHRKLRRGRERSGEQTERTREEGAGMKDEGRMIRERI